MNRALQHEFQPEIHPDAESLNAFVEQALPQPERAQIFEHMAACSQCRQVVFLAQQAATDADAPVAAASQPDPWYRNWHLNWRLAWVPELAAFALIVILVIAHYVRQRPNQNETARSTPPALLVSPAPAIQASATEAQVRQPAPHAALQAAKKGPAAIRETTGAFAPSSASFGVVAGGASQGNVPPAQATPAANGLANPANAIAVEKPALPAWEQQQIAADQPSTDARETHTTPARFRPNAAEAQAGRSMASASTSALQAKAAVAGGAARSMAYGVALSKAGAAKLPSGFAAVSIATAQRRTVAIDPQGNLFVRDSPVATWEPVLRQWTGLAVRVRLKQLPEASVAVDAVVQSGPPAFEMVNDSNLVWESQDGKTWKAQ